MIDNSLATISRVVIHQLTTALFRFRVASSDAAGTLGVGVDFEAAICHSAFNAHTRTTQMTPEYLRIMACHGFQAF